EHDMKKLDGVTSATSGYSGGTRPNPTYENYHDVDAANPVPHVEVVQVTYDSAKLNYADVLDYYLRHIDPTDGLGQFCDRGAAYRPVIFTQTATENDTAIGRLASIKPLLKAPVAVDVLPAKAFYPAEDYHQNYADKNPIRYMGYRWNCGRDKRVRDVWQGRR
ncbi:MAG: peptide-methionine (S)-S-oxide reductase MsrA, partial [Alphaproteobacteria bacterium]